MRRVRIIIYGRVQGIGFRYYIQKQAKQYGINGFVRNLPDGKVEIDAEGEYESLKGFIGICKKGPKQSAIDECLIHNIPYFGFHHFSIKH